MPEPFVIDPEKLVLEALVEVSVTAPVVLEVIVPAPERAPTVKLFPLTSRVPEVTVSGPPATPRAYGLRATSAPLTSVKPPEKLFDPVKITVPLPIVLSVRLPPLSPMDPLMVPLPMAEPINPYPLAMLPASVIGPAHVTLSSRSWPKDSPVVPPCSVAALE